jgi:hypothetical protein
MDLFVVEGTVVKPSIHALIISPYKEIWERDKIPEKSEAIRTFTYIEFCCSYKKSNPYKGFAEDIRKIKVGEAVYKEDYINFVEDSLIKEGIELYEKLRIEASPTIQYYLAAKAGAEKMMNWLNTFDMATINTRTGMPMYKPREITSALRDTYEVMKTLNALEEKVNEQLFESMKTVGNKEINHFET